jgi:hypothetical protein
VPGKQVTATSIQYLSGMKLFQNFHPESRVWIFLADREFRQQESSEIHTLIQKFCGEWVAHGSKLKADGEIVMKRFIVFMADETENKASGCSVDKLLRFVQDLEIEFQISLLNRQLAAFLIQDRLSVFSLTDLQQKIDSGEIQPQTIYCHQMVTSKQQFDESFMIPVSESWLFRKFTWKLEV